MACFSCRILGIFFTVNFLLMLVFGSFDGHKVEGISNEGRFFNEQNHSNQFLHDDKVITISSDLDDGERSQDSEDEQGLEAFYIMDPEKNVLEYDLRYLRRVLANPLRIRPFITSYLRSTYYTKREIIWILEILLGQLHETRTCQAPEDEVVVDFSRPIIAPSNLVSNLKVFIATHYYTYPSLWGSASAVRKAGESFFLDRYPSLRFLFVATPNALNEEVSPPPTAPELALMCLDLFLLGKFRRSSVLKLLQKFECH